MRRVTYYSPRVPRKKWHVTFDRGKIMQLMKPVTYITGDELYVEPVTCNYVIGDGRCSYRYR